MGNKVHPRIFRTGVIYSWSSKWFSKNDFAKLLREDMKIKGFLRDKLKESAVDRIDIERTARALTITVHSAKPGFIIGRGGTGIEDLKKQLRTLLGQTKVKSNLNLNVIEITNPSLSSNIVLQSMIGEIERRMPFRRVLKQHLDRVQKAGARGVKLQIKGRLNGAEIAREEKLSWGSVPLHNLRADIDYASGFAKTLFGTIGIKVWIYRGDIFEVGQKPATEERPPARRPEFTRRRAVRNEA
jgi:small subunit ribosomal protein S3